MQIKEVNNITHNMDAGVVHGSGKDSQGDGFGSLFDLASFTAAAEVRSSSLNGSQGRARSRSYDRLDSYNGSGRDHYDYSNEKSSGGSLDQLGERVREQITLETPRRLGRDKESAGTQSLNEVLSNDFGNNSSVEINNEKNNAGDATSEVSTEGTAENSVAENANDSAEQVLNEQSVDNAQVVIGQAGGGGEGQASQVASTENSSTQPSGPEVKSQQSQAVPVSPDQNKGENQATLQEAGSSNDTSQKADGEKTLGDQVKTDALQVKSNEQSVAEIKSEPASQTDAKATNESAMPVMDGKGAGQVGAETITDANSLQSLESDKNNSKQNPSTENGTQLSNESSFTTETQTGADFGNHTGTGRENNKNNNYAEIQAQSQLKVGADRPIDIQNIVTTGKNSESGAIDAQQNVDRIVKAARAIINRGSSVVQLRLDPPELGILRIEIRAGTDGLSLQLQTTNQRAQQLLQQHSSELRSALEAHGLQTNKIDVQLRPELSDDQPFDRQNNFQQQGQGRSGQESDQDFQQQFQDFAQQDGQQENEALSNMTDDTVMAADGTTKVVASNEPAISGGVVWQEMTFGNLDMKA